MIRELKFKYLQRREQSLTVVLLDLSASTSSNQTLINAKGVIGGSMFSAYKNRGQMALFAFQGDRTQLLYGPARPPKNFINYLKNLRAGGATPLRNGLLTVARFIKENQGRWRDMTLYLITDGRSHDSINDIDLCCPCIIIDAENTPIRLGRCQTIAAHLGASYIHISELPMQDQQCY